MRRALTWAPAGVALLVLTSVPSALAEVAPVPEDFEAPLTTTEVFTAWQPPVSVVERFLLNPQTLAKEELEETLDAQNDVVTLSDRFLFDFDSADLRPSAASSLDTVLALLEETEGPIEIVGHTDSMGTDAVNQPLSEDRAQAVADYLTSNGIDASRITATGKGSTEPVAENSHPDGQDNPEGRQQNRRVEIRYEG
ncbi:MAG: OmpA family protein [Actinomycetia bacterium]|nr:OmpA family protein [Actinomycetes bacterium]